MKQGYLFFQSSTRWGRLITLAYNCNRLYKKEDDRDYERMLIIGLRRKRTKAPMKDCIAFID